MYRIKFILPVLAMIAISAVTMPGCAGESGNHEAGHENHDDHGDDHGDHEGHDHEGEESEGSEEEGSLVEVNEAGGYGTVVSAEGAISMEELNSMMTEMDSAEVKVRGEVIAACQMSGCWMKINNEGGTDMRVRFTDYGFFVPKDIEGEVIVEGKVKKREIPVDELRHYAEDEGLSEEEVAAITEPGVELAFTADGVLPVEGE